MPILLNNSSLVSLLSVMFDTYDATLKNCPTLIEPSFAAIVSTGASLLAGAVGAAVVVSGSAVVVYSCVVVSSSVVVGSVVGASVGGAVVTKTLPEFKSSLLITTVDEA